MGRLKIRVQPGASKNEIVGFQDDLVRIRLTAPPVEGKANKALVSLLAGILRVSKADISIVTGQAGREKLVDVAGLSSDELKSRLAAASSKTAG
ncbi:MAG: DUF167 domain-containing protein [Chloroflexi bacterium]|nr:DUF167 domain-containing protein [Chloroflexota bacterium]MDA8188672.1 DUF167 domain-containing protein [Dehalococcoidales bacterium]